MALIRCPECNTEFSDRAQCCPKCACPVPKEMKILPVISRRWYDYEANITRGTLSQQVSFFISTVIPECGLQFPPSIKNEVSIWQSVFKQTQGLTRSLTTAEAMANFVVNTEASVQEVCAGLPRCPQCGSYMVREIPSVNRIVGVSLLGFASKNFGKSMECRDCSYRW